MDCSLPGSSIHEIFQARVLEWGAIAFSIFMCMLLSHISRMKKPFLCCKLPPLSARLAAEWGTWTSFGNSLVILLSKVIVV